MSTHLTVETLGRLRNRELSRDEVLAAMRHLAACEACTELNAPLLDVEGPRVRAAFAPAEEPSHPDRERELHPYAAGAADAAQIEIVETHLDGCAQCREEVGRARVAWTRRRRRGAWRAVAAAAAVLVGITLPFVLDRRGDPPPRQQRPPAPVAARPAITPAPPAPVQTERVDPKWETLVAAAVRSRTLPLPASLGELTPSREVLRGDPPPHQAALAPAGVAIDEARPTLTWKNLEGDSYLVSVFDDEGRVAESGVLTSRAWTPPQPLPRGRTYTWQIEVTRGGATELVPSPPAPLAMFRVVSRAEHEDIESALQRYPAHHLLHAVLYARAGLRAEAAAALRRAKEAGQPGAREIRAP